MTARATVGLLPMLPADAAIIAAIFRASIEELTGEDYNPAQQEAWMSGADDEAAFYARRAADLTLIATIAHAPVGFASLRGNNHIEMLFIHPRAARQGVGRSLCDALETLAAARGTTRITADVSDTAQPFFTARGYASVHRQTRECNGEWLVFTTMEKQLAPVTKGSLL